MPTTTIDLSLGAKEAEGEHEAAWDPSVEPDTSTDEDGDGPRGGEDEAAGDPRSGSRDAATAEEARGEAAGERERYNGASGARIVGLKGGGGRVRGGGGGGGGGGRSARAVAGAGIPGPHLDFLQANWQVVLAWD